MRLQRDSLAPALDIQRLCRILRDDIATSGAVVGDLDLVHGRGIGRDPRSKALSCLRVVADADSGQRLATGFLHSFFIDPLDVVGLKQTQIVVEVAEQDLERFTAAARLHELIRNVLDGNEASDPFQNRQLELQPETPPVTDDFRRNRSRSGLWIDLDNPLGGQPLLQALELTCGNRIAGLGSQQRIVVARPQQSGQIVLLGEPLVQTLVVGPLAEPPCFELARWRSLSVDGQSHRAQSAAARYRRSSAIALVGTASSPARSPRSIRHRKEGTGVDSPATPTGLHPAAKAERNVAISECSNSRPRCLGWDDSLRAPSSGETA
jgi:hypothetical protein